MKNLTFTFNSEKQHVDVFHEDLLIQSVGIDSKGVVNSNDFNHLANKLNISLEDELEDLNYAIFRCQNERKPS